MQQAGTLSRYELKSCRDQNGVMKTIWKGHVQYMNFLGRKSEIMIGYGSSKRKEISTVTRPHNTLSVVISFKNGSNKQS